VSDIKDSYRRLSRKLHPDMVAQSKILPGKCRNMDDVREEWEKVKFSYEILSDTKMRKNYDRNSSVAEVLDDPGGAVGRAVIGGTMTGLGMVFGSAWKLGEIATKKVFAAPTVEKEVAQETKADAASSEEEDEEAPPQNQAWTQAQMMEAAKKGYAKKIESEKTEKSLNGSSAKPISIPESSTGKDASVNQDESSGTRGFISKPMPENNVMPNGIICGGGDGNDISSDKPISMPESPTAEDTSTDQEESNDDSSFKSKPAPEKNVDKARDTMKGNHTNSTAGEPISMTESPTEKALASATSEIISTETTSSTAAAIEENPAANIALGTSTVSVQPTSETNSAKASDSVNGNDSISTAGEPISMPESPTEKALTPATSETDGTKTISSTSAATKEHTAAKTAPETSSGSVQPAPETSSAKASDSVNGNDTSSSADEPISMPGSPTEKAVITAMSETNGAKTTSSTSAAAKENTAAKKSPNSMPENSTTKGINANQEEGDDVGSFKTEAKTEANGAQANDNDNGSSKTVVKNTDTITSSAGITPSTPPPAEVADSAMDSLMKAVSSAQYAADQAAAASSAVASKGAVKVSIKNNYDIDFDTISSFTPTITSPSTSAKKKKTGAKKKKALGGKGFGKQK